MRASDPALLPGRTNRLKENLTALTEPYATCFPRPILAWQQRLSEMERQHEGVGQLGWYRLSFSQREVHLGTYADLSTAVKRAYAAAGAPSEAAVFSAREPETGYVVWYLSPAGFILSRNILGDQGFLARCEPCMPPARDAVYLRIGNASAHGCLPKRSASGRGDGASYAPR